MFGSKSDGKHDSGDALLARERFGAEEGLSEGPQGNSYAIPVDGGSVEALKPYVDRFLELAAEWDQNTFVVSRIGRDAGLSDEQVAPLFANALKLYNVVLPESFVNVIRRSS